MVTSDLPDHIEQLVERLRRKDHPNVSLTEVAAVTEVLMRSLDSYFQSIDLTLYTECQELADYIKDARQEIAALSPDHADEAHIPRAGKELDAIVRQTEEATNTIMEAAESIMSADPEDVAGYQATVNDEVMRIFEACSFQDITGQRISKVVETLQNIEARVFRLIEVLNVEGAADIGAPIDTRSEDEKLLNGPALDGEGIDQTDVDALFNSADDDSAEPTAPAAPEATPAKPAKPAATLTMGSSHKKAGVSKATDVEDIVLKQDDEGRTTQDDIDALFG